MEHLRGRPINADCINEITKSFPKLPVQIGGGIRDLKTASTYIEAGISYLIIGTMAVKNPDFVEELCLCLLYTSDAADE